MILVKSLCKLVVIAFIRFKQIDYCLILLSEMRISVLNLIRPDMRWSWNLKKKKNIFFQKRIKINCLIKLLLIFFLSGYLFWYYQIIYWFKFESTAKNNSVICLLKGDRNIWDRIYNVNIFDSITTHLWTF